MRAEVRDDIIGLDSFVAAKFKFEKYIQLIRDAGNYCFLDQFKRHFEKGAYIASQLEDSNLIKTATLNNNYKYIYLTDTAMKYLVLKDDPRDFSDVKKSSISVAKVNKYPSEKVLMSSALKFAIIAEGFDCIIKEKLINSLENKFYKQHDMKRNYEYNTYDLNSELSKLKDIIVNQKRIKSVIDETEQLDMLKYSNKVLKDKFELADSKIQELKKERESLNVLNKKRKKEIDEEIHQFYEAKGCLVAYAEVKAITEKQRKQIESVIHEFENKCVEIEKQIERYNRAKEENKEKMQELEKLKNKVINLYDKSKIIVLTGKDVLQFCILDTGNTKTAYGYLKAINELKEFGYKFDKIQVVIFSYSKKRAESLKAEFEETQKERDKALNRMQKYEDETEVSRDNRKNWRYDPPEYYKNAENIYYNTPSIEILTMKNTWYMENYKKNISYSESYIKEKDKKAIKKLKEKLKKEK